MPDLGGVGLAIAVLGTTWLFVQTDKWLDRRERGRQQQARIIRRKAGRW